LRKPTILVERHQLKFLCLKKNTKLVTDASKEVVLKVNTEKTKYILLSRHQNTGQNHDIKTSNSSSENVAQFKYLGPTVTNQNVRIQVMVTIIQSRSICLLVCSLKT
jgi:predicted secreted protein